MVIPLLVSVAHIAINVFNYYSVNFKCLWIRNSSKSVKCLGYYTLLYY